jgi:hypothetical protein
MLDPSPDRSANRHAEEHANDDTEKPVPVVALLSGGHSILPPRFHHTRPWMAPVAHESHDADFVVVQLDALAKHLCKRGDAQDRDRERAMPGECPGDTAGRHTHPIELRVTAVFVHMRKAVTDAP